VLLPARQIAPFLYAAQATLCPDRVALAGHQMARYCCVAVTRWTAPIERGRRMSATGDRQHKLSSVCGQGHMSGLFLRHTTNKGFRPAIDRELARPSTDTARPPRLLPQGGLSAAATHLLTRARQPPARAQPLGQWPRGRLFRPSADPRQASPFFAFTPTIGRSRGDVRRHSADTGRKSRVRFDPRTRL